MKCTRRWESPTLPPPVGNPTVTPTGRNTYGATSPRLKGGLGLRDMGPVS